MPAATKVQLVFRLLDDFQKLRMPLHAFDIGMHIQRSEPTRKAFLRVWRQVCLIAEKDDVVVKKGAVDLVKLRVR